jgi:ribose transport system substrate-binding protein
VKPKRRELGLAAAVLSVLLFGCCAGADAAEDGPTGMTVPTALSAFDRDAAACKAPPGLEKVLAFAQDNEREFMQGVGRGLAAAAEDRRLAFRVELARNDASRMNEHLPSIRSPSHLTCRRSSGAARSWGRSFRHPQRCC